MARFVFDRDAALRNIRLRFLEDSVQEDRFARIFDEIAQLIGASERAYAEATSGNDKDGEYLAEICDEETETIEELIGVVFLVLQMKITRVKTAASRLFEKGDDLLGLCGNHESYQHSLIKLIWEVANYYKHKEAWPNSQHRDTLEVAEKLGLLTKQSGDMALAFEKLGITRPYSECKNLSSRVQDWAKQVLSTARDRVRSQNSQH